MGTDGLTDKALLITDPSIEQLSQNKCMTVCNMGIELGAMITLFCTATKENDVAQTIELSLDTLVQKAACPFSPANIANISHLQGLKENQVHPDINMFVVPASIDVLDQMENNGWTKVIRDAGVIILNPGCGPCFGVRLGLASEKDVVASTTNHILPGCAMAEDFENLGKFAMWGSEIEDFAEQVSSGDIIVAGRNFG